MFIYAILTFSLVLSPAAYSPRKGLPQYASPINQSPSIMDLELLPELRARDASPIDLYSMLIDECFLGDLFDDCHSIKLIYVPQCHLVPALCPAGSDDTECFSYTKECFCNAPTPLSYAWDCSWTGWMYVEDWLSQQCP